MIYTRDGDRVTLEMSANEWAQLLIITGMGLGTVHRRAGTGAEFYMWIRFVNELNRTNPQYTPYEIPAEFQTPC